MRSTFILTVTALALFAFNASSHALEPWADHRLTVTNDLELWLDASKEIPARTDEVTKGAPPQVRSSLVNGGPLDVWHDASGNKRNVRQPVPAARPRFQQTSSTVATVQFGGDDYMIASGLNHHFDETTIFIVATPRTNNSGFSAFLAMNREGANDYSSGINVDLGPESKKRFDFLNVEGAGFTGIQDMMDGSVPFGQPHVLTIRAEAGTNFVTVAVDGVLQKINPFVGIKPRKSNRANRRGPVASEFGFDQVTIGTRFFSNTAEPAHVQGFFEGDIAEVIIYSRVLSDEECNAVENYLKSKLPGNAGGRTLAPLIAITNPPPIQVFRPGFAVRELPVSLKNINCVKYREDGKLVALGYDGSIWLLSDTDGDGLEDKAQPFWDKPTLRSPIGLALTPPGYIHGQGVFVPSKGKVSLIVDTNRDDVADREIVIADGWKESTHGVDALGIAVDKEGSVYYALGTASFIGAYLIDPQGRSQYSLKDEHGTILKISPDFKSREIVCTGTRYPVALAFNAAGDLFCSDQEGATWLPNGNPFDELLHIQPGRHYGFPPRHPKHLPGVIDEPSVFDYGPQHQCTCGVNFNEPVNGGSAFGPSWWKGDAFVAGYSRAKLFRTKLVKTAAGYIAQNEIFAIGNMLPPDMCVSPAGDLVVPVHSGKPDWGSGPTGDGKIYKISYTDKVAPQPVSVWAQSPTETRIEFDRPLNAESLRDAMKRISITQGKYVSAGDRFETIRPGYQVVQNQMLEPRYAVNVVSTALSADGRAMIIRTEPRTEAVNYAIALPRSAENRTGKELRQESVIELAHDLAGVQADWQNAAGTDKWSGWLPHLDLTAARSLTTGSGVHDALWARAKTTGRLKLQTKLDLWQMLRAATQPGSQLDYRYPPETVTVVFKSKVPFTVTAPTMRAEKKDANEFHLTAVPKENVWFPVELAIDASNGGELALDVSWFTAEDSRERALPLRRLLLPWSTPQNDSAEPPHERAIPQIAGGNWLNGKKIFFGAQAACSKCHAIGGAGGRIGPDLSNLIHRDYESVIKDIIEPSAAINPDHLSYNVEFKDGESLTGLLVGSTETESKFADASGNIKVAAKSDIATMAASTISLMPEGLLTPFSEQQRKDLLTFLLMPPPVQVAPLEREGEPPARKMVEFESLLKETQTAPPMNVVLCAGPKDHGPGEHDYPLWQKRWSKLLALATNVTVSTADPWPSSQQFAKADVIVFYSNNPGWAPERAAELDGFLNRGGGLVYIHYAVDGHQHCEELAQRIGLAWRGGQSKFRHGPLNLKFESHPLGEGFTQADFVDESYWDLVGSETNIQLLASGIEGDRPRPLMWTREQGKGRIFVSIPGHYSWTFDDPLFRVLIFRGVAWSARQPIHRLDDLVTVGARIAE